MQNIYILRSAKYHVDTNTYVDRGTVQSLVKIADDMAIMGTADSKTPITVRFGGGGGGLIKAYATYAPINRHKLYVAAVALKKDNIASDPLVLPIRYGLVTDLYVYIGDIDSISML